MTWTTVHRSCLYAQPAHRYRSDAQNTEYSFTPLFDLGIDIWPCPSLSGHSRNYRPVNADIRRLVNIST